MRVLIADDCPVTRLRLKKHLIEWGFQPILTCDGVQALDALTSRFAPRLAVLDWMMPKMDGPTVTRRLRQEDIGPYAYIVMLTSKNNAEDLVSAFTAGIDDFLTKPFNPEELHQRLRAGQRILHLHDQLNSTLEKLKYQATHDSLTGIWNRRAILDSLERELNRASRQVRPQEATSIVLLDIDRFKSINDNFGHVAGDKVLREIGSIVKKSLRSYDYIGRYGGEEFVIILPSTARNQVEIIVERIRANIANTPIDIGDGKTINVTACLGVATADNENSDVEQLIRQADKAMYEAKSHGRNGCIFAEHSDPDESFALPEAFIPTQLGSDEPANSQVASDHLSEG